MAAMTSVCYSVMVTVHLLIESIIELVRRLPLYVTADLNNDKHPDIVVTNYDSNDISVLLAMVMVALLTRSLTQLACTVIGHHR